MPLKCRRLGNFLLLEVLIAFALVVMAVLPLIYPHFYIYRQQRAFIDKIDLDIAVNQIYVNIVEKLYRNEIPWGDIQHKRVIPIDSQLLEGTIYAKSFPFEGTYQFEIARKKKNPQYGLNQVKLVLAFDPKKPAKSDIKDDKTALSYTYNLFIAQLFSGGAEPEAATGQGAVPGTAPGANPGKGKP